MYPCFKISKWEDMFYPQILLFSVVEQKIYLCYVVLKLAFTHKYKAWCYFLLSLNEMLAK